MPGSSSSLFLAISRDTELVHALDLFLLAAGLRMRTAASPEAALAALTGTEPPCLVLADIHSFTDNAFNSLSEWLARVRAADNGHRVPVVLLSDSVSDNWMELVSEGMLDDLIPRTGLTALWRLRLTVVLNGYHRTRELESLRGTTALDAQLDSLTHTYNRAALLSILFRETDRVQRMKTPLSLILIGLGNMDQYSLQLGSAATDDLLCQLVARTTRLLRSYDAFGRMGNDEFLLVLPGCATADALVLAERLRIEVFSSPFFIAGEVVNLSACFGIAPSQGRSPIVILRAAEQALAQARLLGHQTIQCAGSGDAASAAPADFLSSSPDEELLTW